MELSRRDFLKLSGASAGGLALYKALTTDEVLAASSSSQVFPLKTKVNETSTICCYCGVGCGAIVTQYEGGLIKVDGDPDHPINKGTLCSKGAALAQMHQIDGEPNPRRLAKPLYRAAGGTKWEEKSWDWTLDTIATRIKDTRDNNWTDKVTIGDTEYAVNRTDAIANFGGGELDNEECYLLVKMARALGLVYIEHCARI